MRWWLNALFTSVLFVVVTAIDSLQDEVLRERSLRISSTSLEPGRRVGPVTGFVNVLRKVLGSPLVQELDFPWLSPLNRRPGHDRRFTLFRGSVGEELPRSGHVENAQEDFERRRRDGHALKRYTCRFKFCRIFDA